MEELMLLLLLSPMIPAFTMWSIRRSFVCTEKQLDLVELPLWITKEGKEEMWRVAISLLSTSSELMVRKWQPRPALRETSTKVGSRTEWDGMPSSKQ